ncbi:caspase family protein [Streptomyces antimicrobicus]|uniref:Caspase family protein n=1 Tax=Streptomyces antimicrobicus TaxID=2883108 RepID=A0ABS8BES9_9ACTN|nr:caspase family protein [Streptomyces antimicrobicus]MCB5183033.1 caspase family protein [Streptomyces antimicrobicus]
MPKGLSLHIGLNSVDPDRYDGWNGRLVACENDARDMAAIARANGFSDTLILTRDGTVDNITAQLREAAGQLKSGDILLFTYSGHGGQMPDLTGDADVETDRKDETLVFFDRQFLDDELYKEFQAFDQGVRIVAVLDCCHSGTSIESVQELLSPQALETQFGSSAPQQVEAAARVMPMDKQEQILERDRAFFEDLQRGLKKGNGKPADAVLIGACQDNQLASDGSVNGLFTEKLLKVWDNGGFRGGYREFHRDIQKHMPAIQSPNFYTTGTPSDAFLRQKPFTV